MMARGRQLPSEKTTWREEKASTRRSLRRDTIQSVAKITVARPTTPGSAVIVDAVASPDWAHFM
jgi:hypothetical protein